MGDESYGFDKTRARLDEIVGQVRQKDVSLEKSLDLLEEGVRLANQCVELIDHADWETAATGSAEPSDSDEADGEPAGVVEEESAASAGVDDGGGPVDAGDARDEA